MATVDIDAATDEYLTFAANIAGIPKGQVVARLVAQARSAAGTETPGNSTGVDVYADYEGHRTRARFIGASRIEIVDGPLTGAVYQSPSEAARAVVAHYKPSVSPHRNGWSFWLLAGSGEPLQTVRHHAR